MIVKRLKSSSMEIYVKGAPEVMPDICNPASCKPGLPLFLGKLTFQSRWTTRICYPTILEMDSESLLSLVNLLKA